MSSLEDLAAARIAIELCNNSELKKEILREHEFDSKEILRFEQMWENIVKRKAETIQEKFGLIKQQKQKTTALVVLIGLRMLKWTVYHERTLGLTREFSIKFFNSSLFTSEGIVDNKKAAEELMKDKNLSIKQKYKLACLYCSTEHILDFYKEMSQEEKEQFYEDQDHKGSISQI